MPSGETIEHRNQTIHQLVKELVRCPYKRKPWACTPFGSALRRAWRSRRPIWRSVIQILTFMTLTLYVTSCLPRPDWLVCGSVVSSPQSSDRNNSLAGIYGIHYRAKVIDPHLRGVLRMFTVYNYNESFTETAAESKKSEASRDNTDKDADTRQSARLKIVPSSDNKLLRDYVTELDRRRGNSSSGVLFPECVRFVGPQEMKSPKICIHQPEKDKVISMVLRASGTWELDRLIDMEWTMQAYNDMQLVDLGCNVGVFTLYAAGMGRHVLAVDASPSNLRLLQASLTINDHQNGTYVIMRNTSHMYPVRQKSNTKAPPVPEKTVAADSANFKRNRTGVVLNGFQLDKAIGSAVRTSQSLGESPQGKKSYKDKYKIKRRYRNKPRNRRMSRKLLQAIKSQEQNRNNRSFTLNKTLRVQPITNKDVNIKNLATSPVKQNNTFGKENPSPRYDENRQRDTVTISRLVTLVQNAVYSDRTSQLALYLKPDGNVGGAEIVPLNSRLLEDDSGNTVFVDAVCLDDLLPLVKAPSVYLKMDIEGSEPHVLKCAQKFFEKVHVRFVLMEWLFQLRSVGSSRPLAHEMIRFFTAKGYIPTTGAGIDVRGGAGENRGVSVLDVNEWNRWPELVLWMER